MGLGNPKGRGDIDRLNQSLLSIVEILRPSDEERWRHWRAFECVRAIILKEVPHAKVHLFGSAANGLNVTNVNDLDLCLEVPEVGVDDVGVKGAIIEKVGQLLEREGMKDIFALPKARVPVCKFTIAETNTRVDITVNNMLAIVNTKLLRDYSRLDPRLQQLVYAVKHWAKQRNVNDAYRGTLSSYAYVLLCISFLQQRQPAILPCLQQLQPTFKATIGQWSCEFNDDVEGLQGFGSSNTESLAELLIAFFDYWARRHDYNNAVVSIRMGGMISKADKDWTRRIGNERHLVCIEDPFELTHDLGRTIDRSSCMVLRREFERAANILATEADPLPKLFESYRTNVQRY